MVCVLVAAPVSVNVILAVKAAVCGLRRPGFAVTVRIAGPPGSTMPLVGATVSQEAVPAEAENDTGPLLVDNWTVCATVAGGTATAGVKITAAVYVPTASPVGFTCRATLAGSAPQSGLAVSHNAVVVV